MKNLKDKITSFAAILVLVGGGIATASTAGATLPAWLVTYSIIAASIGGGITAFASGKNSDLSSKTPEQIAAGLAPVMSQEATVNAIQAASTNPGTGLKAAISVLTGNAVAKPVEPKPEQAK